MRKAIIPKRPLILLVIVLILVAMINSFAISTFIGLYHTSSSLLGKGEDTMVIYGEQARTPMTSTVPITLYNLLNVNGVEVISPEVIAPISLSGRATIARGIDPEAFFEMQDLHILSGEKIHANDTLSAMLGSKVSQRLRIHVGEKVLVLAGLVEQPIELTVKGVFESGTSLDDEVLVSLWAGQWLRGLSPQYVSLMRVKVDRTKLTPSSLQALLSDEGRVKEGMEKPTTGEGRSILELIPMLKAPIEVKEYDVKKPEESIRLFLERETGLTETTLWTLFALVLIATTLTMHQAASTLIHGSSREIAIIRSLGASKRELWINLSALGVLISFISGGMGFMGGFALASLLSQQGLLVIAAYTLIPTFSLWGFVAALLTITGVVLVSIRLSLTELFSISIHEAIAKGSI